MKYNFGGPVQGYLDVHLYGLFQTESEEGRSRFISNAA